MCNGEWFKQEVGNVTCNKCNGNQVAWPADDTGKITNTTGPNTRCLDPDKVPQVTPSTPSSASPLFVEFIVFFLIACVCVSAGVLIVRKKKVNYRHVQL